jgi:putative xylitol transport system ATP-binding protein
LSILGRLQDWGIIRRKDELSEIDKVIGMMRIVTPGSEQLVRNLSGGNQQKVVLGRCILTDPKILLLDEPTRGVDVGAKKEIYRFMSDFTAKGGGVVMVSSELEEIVGMSDRIIVFRRGRPNGVFARGDATQKKLMMAAV